MKFTVLIDNNPNPDTDLLTEHGLSIYIEINSLKLLYDTGKSDAFIKNASKLGINLKNVNYLILSHGHGDHTGGLGAFLDLNSKAMVFLSEKIKTQSFYSNKLTDPKDISTDHHLFEIHKGRFEFINQNGYISDCIGLINSFNNTYPTPKGNRHLLTEINNRMVLDVFNHETALSIKISDKIVVFSACSHNGLLNTLNAVTNFWKNKNVILFAGGTHLIGSNSGLYENDEELLNIARSYRAEYPEAALVTGHCTGIRAMENFTSMLGDKFEKFYSGFSKTI